MLLAAGQTGDPAVYGLTLKARATLEYATREPQFRRAIELFQSAIDRDPSYAPAWAGLAESTWSFATMEFGFVEPVQVREIASAAAEKAWPSTRPCPGPTWPVASSRRRENGTSPRRSATTSVHSSYDPGMWQPTISTLLAALGLRLGLRLRPGLLELIADRDFEAMARRCWLDAWTRRHFSGP